MVYDQPRGVDFVCEIPEIFNYQAVWIITFRSIEDNRLSGVDDFFGNAEIRLRFPVQVEVAANLFLAVLHILHYKVHQDSVLMR